MAKAAVFIDGSWLSIICGDRLHEEETKDLVARYAELPTRLISALSAHLVDETPLLGRTYYFGSFPVYYDEVDRPVAERFRAFHNGLRSLGWTLETYSRGCHGYRLIDDAGRLRLPKEKCVDVALASTLVYLASSRDPFDIAIAVVGDRDFAPALRLARRAGKRVAIATASTNSWPGYWGDAETKRAEPIRDFPPIWLESVVPAIREQGVLAASIPTHSRVAESRQEPEREEGRRAGIVLDMNADPPFGYIEGEDGEWYMFLPADLSTSLSFGDLRPGTRVSYAVAELPDPVRVGKATKIRL
jgi:uncharacterized LabA/DUF88 family protein